MSKPSGIISLITDFGLEDEYVGVMKGVMLSINHKVQIVDISHNLDRQNILQAAFIINYSYKYFPQGTIHLVVVDPGVGGDRSIVCIQREGHIFVVPDNGVMSLVLKGTASTKVNRVVESIYFLKHVSNSFHGRDIFAPVAAQLSKGLDPDRLGLALDPEELTLLDCPTAQVSSANELCGEIIGIDHFGNLVTNIDIAVCDNFVKANQTNNIIVQIGSSEVRGIFPSYDSVPSGAPVAIFGSRNLLEISVNCGDAGKHFKAGLGEAVKVRVRM